MSEDTVSTRLAVATRPSARPEPSGEANPQLQRRREPRIVTPRATPVSKCHITLNTEFAQRVFYRCWDRLKADLYVLTVRTRTADQNEAAGALESVISESFDKARTDLASDLERTEVLRDHVKLRDVPDYEDRLETVATYSTPRAREFLALIQQMDQLLVLYDGLWLGGFATTQERVQRSQNWQRRMVKITNRLRELANRTRVSLARQTEAAPSVSSPAGAGTTSPHAEVDSAVGPEGAAASSSPALEESAEEPLSEEAEEEPGVMDLPVATTTAQSSESGEDERLDEALMESTPVSNGHDETAEVLAGVGQKGPQSLDRAAPLSRRSS